MTDSTSSTVSGTTVLVVDDDTAVLGLCKAILESEGFAVLQARGSCEALKLCAEHKGRIDLIVSDLLLPVPDFQVATSTSPYPRVRGHELIQLALEMKKEIRAVATSGWSQEVLAVNGIRAANLPFLSKPFGPKDLIDKVREVLAGPPLVHTEKKPTAQKAGGDPDWFG
jgi:DNA-binding NtrC family response regulator